MTVRFHPALGAWLDDEKWVPMPRYLMRRDRVLSLAAPLQRGRLLEVGCGAGALIYDLLKMGFDCHAVEESAQAREMAGQFGERFGFVPSAAFCGEWRELMDILVSMDVLEHIEDDEAALAEWVLYLKTGGYLLLGVPCHMSKWGPIDEWAGHYRRYERQELVEKLAAVGLEVIRFETYGFPMANLTSALRNRMFRNLDSDAGMTAAERTRRSGVDRSSEGGLFPLLKSWPGRIALRAGYLMQRLFLRTNLGDGFLVLARKVN